MLSGTATSIRKHILPNWTPKAFLTSQVIIKLADKVEGELD
jgi:hypothetical protein